jgi:hypothetical protein
MARISKAALAMRKATRRTRLSNTMYLSYFQRFVRHTAWALVNIVWHTTKTAATT